MEMFAFSIGVLALGCAALWVAVFGIDIRVHSGAVPSPAEED